MSKLKKFDEYKKLSDDIVVVSKNMDGDFEKITEPINILQITGMVTDEIEIQKIEEGFTLDTSLTIKDTVKRGDVIYLTALIQRTKGASISSQTLSVIKVRVLDYYNGLNKLNQVVPNK